MQQPRRDGNVIELHIRDEAGHLQWVGDVLLAGAAALPRMLDRREFIGAVEQIGVGFRIVRPGLHRQIIEANHDKRCLNNEIRGS